MSRPRQASSLITQEPENQQSENPESVEAKAPMEEVLKLMQVKEEVLGKLQVLDKLNSTYRDKTETAFFKTFVKIMKQMGEALTDSVEHYQNIDQEIQSDEKCVFLREQVLFFKNEHQSLLTKKKLQEQKLQAAVELNNALKKQKKKVKSQVLKHETKRQKYYSKNRILSVSLEKQSSKQSEKLSGIRNNLQSPMIKRSNGRSESTRMETAMRRTFTNLRDRKINQTMLRSFDLSSLNEEQPSRQLEKRVFLNTSQMSRADSPVRDRMTQGKLRDKFQEKNRTRNQIKASQKAKLNFVQSIAQP